MDATAPWSSALGRPGSQPGLPLPLPREPLGVRGEEGAPRALCGYRQGGAHLTSQGGRGRRAGVCVAGEASGLPAGPCCLPHSGGWRAPEPEQCGREGRRRQGPEWAHGALPRAVAALLVTIPWGPSAPAQAPGSHRLPSPPQESSFMPGLWCPKPTPPDWVGDPRVTLYP